MFSKGYVFTLHITLAASVTDFRFVHRMKTERNEVKNMKLNKEKIDRLSKLPDDELWAEIRTMLSKHGIHLAERVPTHEDMTRLREAFTLGEGISPMEAVRFIGEYKRKYMR